MIMELNEALKVVVELAEQNMLNDPEMQCEMLQQMNAIEAVRMHMQELQNPSPLQVVLVTEGGVIHESISNVPAEITVLAGDIEGATDDSCRCIDAVDGSKYCIGSFNSITDPTLVADILKEVSA
jgi:hypothetical protein